MADEHHYAPIYPTFFEELPPPVPPSEDVGDRFENQPSHVGNTLSIPAPTELEYPAPVEVELRPHSNRIDLPSSRGAAGEDEPAFDIMGPQSY